MSARIGPLADLITEVCAAEGAPVPAVRWDSRDGRWSSGTTYTAEGRTTYTAEGRITFTLGTNALDRKLIVLHELAHWLTPKDRGHGREFWSVAMRLYRRYGIGWGYIHLRECCDSKGAHKAHRELSVALAKGQP